MYMGKEIVNRLNLPFSAEVYFLLAGDDLAAPSSELLFSAVFFHDLLSPLWESELDGLLTYS